jgi:hypothetical protein
MLNLREDDYVNENSETDLIPEIYLLFTNNFLKLFEDIKLLEKNNTTCVDLRVFSRAGPIPEFQIPIPILRY